MNRPGGRIPGSPVLSRLVAALPSPVLALGAMLALVAGIEFVLAGFAGLVAVATVGALVWLLALRSSLQAAPPPVRAARRHRRRWRWRRGGERDASFPALNRAESVAFWASGRMRDWDLHVRPTLARLLAAIVAQDSRRAGGPEAVARYGPVLLGERLWPLVDPRRPTATDRDLRGPGLAALNQILDRLEAARDRLEQP